ncbi:MAG: NTP transferase domain-containing protein [Nanoarchaeota archaeon]|nr:NTP transferase domain-containing protein [Nanoarchaeota archaeon]
MADAIVLAGGKVKKSLFDPIKFLWYYAIYGERYYFASGKYKPLIKVYNEIGGIKKPRPLVEYTLHSLFSSKNVEKIVVVGEKERLENSLDLKIKNYSSKCHIVQQRGGLIENIIFGSSFLEKKGHALIISADSPLITSNSIDQFIEDCSNKKENFDFFFAITSRKNLYKYEKVIYKPYFWMINDQREKGDIFKDKYDRSGFRVANMAFVDIEKKIKNRETIKMAYSLRKLKDPFNLFKIFQLYKKETIKYFSKTLKMSEVEKAISASFETRFKLIEVEDPNFSLDVDSEEDHKAIEFLQKSQ